MSEPNEGTALVPTSEERTFNREQLDLIKRTVANGTDDTEFALFIEVAKRTGLDPFSKQIYAVMRWDNETKRKKMTIQTGIDGYFAIADRTGEMAGVDDILFDTEDGTHPNRATATVWRWKRSERVPYTYTARWSEYVQTNKDGNPTSMWQRMPYTMLGKCAQARALRMAFPAQIGGVYTTEEMEQAAHDDGATWEQVRQLADLLQLGTQEKASVFKRHKRNAAAIYQELRQRWEDTQQAVEAAPDTTPDTTPEPEGEPELEPDPTPAASADTDGQRGATEAQLRAIAGLCERLGEPVPEIKSYGHAAALMTRLNNELQRRRKAQQQQQ